MLTEEDVETHCFTPRDYQVELLDKACKRNIIVQLGTGFGKTFIAVLLLKEYAAQIMSPYENGGKRAFFIVDKVSLVYQKAEHIERHTSFSVGKIYGNLHKIIWNNKSKFDQFISEHNVVVITAQPFLHLIDHAHMDIARLAIVIFDECHHALGEKHPYRVTMHRIMRVPEAYRPRILGLTASVINDRTPPNELQQKVLKLERVLNSSIETASNLVTISQYGARPAEIVVSTASHSFSDSCVGGIVRLLEEWQKFCSCTQEFVSIFDTDPGKPVLEALNRTLAVLRQVGPWAAWKVSQMWEKKLHKLSRQSLLQEKAVDFLIMGRTCMTAVLKVLGPKVPNCYDETNQVQLKNVALIHLVLRYGNSWNWSQARHNSASDFSKMERIIESGMVRVTVDIGNKMKFTGMGRNYRITKTTAAKRALKYLKSMEEQKLRDAGLITTASIN